MLIEVVLAKHTAFCRDNCASFHKQTNVCGHALMNTLLGHQGQGKCPWQDEEILRHTGGKR